MLACDPQPIDLGKLQTPPRSVVSTLLVAALADPLLALRLLCTLPWDMRETFGLTAPPSRARIPGAVDARQSVWGDCTRVLGDESVICSFPGVKVKARWALVSVPSAAVR